jgi:hypothetical protein
MIPYFKKSSNLVKSFAEAMASPVAVCESMISKSSQITKAIDNRE